MIMYLPKHHIRKTGRNDQLCVSQLSSYFLEFMTDDVILNKTLPQAGRAPTRDSPLFDMLLQDSKVWVIDLCILESVGVNQ